MYKKKWICQKCGYETNKKQNYEKHISRPNACEKRLKRYEKNTNTQNVNPLIDNINNSKIYNINSEINICDINELNVSQNINSLIDNGSQNAQNINSLINPVSQNVNLNNTCYKCSKRFTRKSNLLRHLKICNGLDPLQCPKCKIFFSCAAAKSRHIKNVKCELVLTEDQQRIKELEEQLEESEAKRIEAENSKSTINYNITNNTNNTNNYFDHSINYNNYDNLNLDHITKEDIKRLFNNCRMQYPELSEDLTRMILSPKENQCIYLPEGQKSNTCAVIKDGVEMRKPLIRVLMDLGVQTATLIRDSNVIVRNKKDAVNNQFWADNRNACGLNISDIEYMTDNDKEIVQRNKNIVLDMSDGKI